MAVVLNGLTTMAGFASLMVAHHQGSSAWACSSPSG